jgi:hypothetical protein
MACLSCLGRGGTRLECAAATNGEKGWSFVVSQKQRDMECGCGSVCAVCVLISSCGECTDHISVGKRSWGQHACGLACCSERAVCLVLIWASCLTCCLTVDWYDGSSIGLYGTLLTLEHHAPYRCWQDFQRIATSQPNTSHRNVFIRLSHTIIHQAKRGPWIQK